ncbi:MAG: competence/damage-inducible protein A, partial [Candidatus Zixiibacteriota bacterium]
MKAEVITIGDEILLGQTIDTNSAFISRELSQLGIDVNYKTSVGDDIQTISEALTTGLSRADLVITTGGLGPTNDDITKKAIVKVFKRNLVFHEEILKKVEEGFRKRGMEMPKINQNQALQPQGSKALPNQFGSAPGIFIQEKDKIFFALPGVPLEMRSIMENDVLPLLQRVSEVKVFQRKLRTTDMPESLIYEMIEPIINNRPEVKVAFLPGFLGVDIRLNSESQEKLEGMENNIKEVLGNSIYGEDDISLEEVVGKLLKDKGKTISVAESCTGGLIGKRFTNVSGSSEYFERGVVSYSNQAKMEILKVPQDMIEKHGAVSEQVAILMAEGIRKISRTDYGLSVTGIAGPTGGTEEKPVGLVWIGFAHENDSFAQKFLFGEDRETNRQRAAQAALNLVRL